MKNIEQWRPSKYEYIRGKLKGSRNKKEVAPSSRLIVDLVADFYEVNLPKYASGVLVDLGCGKAPLYHAYNNLVKEVICVDWANSFHKNPYLDIIQDLNEPIKMGNNSCDTIILSDVLEHIREPKALVGEMNRILRKDGKILMNVPFYYWLHEQPFDFFRYTQFALEYFAKESGLKILKLEPYGGSVEIMADVLSKQLIVIPLLGRFFSILIQSIAGFWVSTSIGKRIAKRTGQVFPLGYVLVLEK